MGWQYSGALPTLKMRQEREGDGVTWSRAISHQSGDAGARSSLGCPAYQSVQTNESWQVWRGEMDKPHP